MITITLGSTTVPDGEGVRRIRSGVEERPILGGRQNPHGLQPGGL